MTRELVRAKANRVKACLTAWLNEHCGEGHPFRIISGAVHCFIMMKDDEGVWKAEQKLLYVHENFWGIKDIFTDIIDNIIQKKIGKQKQGIFSLKAQLKPFLTPMQEVSFE